MLILDSGAVSLFAERSRAALALIMVLKEEGLWPPTVPAIVLVESLQGHPGRDANTNRFLKACDIVQAIDETHARRAALLRRRASRGSAVDALVVTFAEPGGIVLTADPKDLKALAAYANEVTVQAV